jgi:hypothetical protein
MSLSRMSLSSLFLAILLLMPDEDGWQRRNHNAGVAIALAHSHDCGAHDPSPKDEAEAERAEIEMFGKTVQ